MLGNLTIKYFSLEMRLSKASNSDRALNAKCSRVDTCGCIMSTDMQQQTSAPAVCPWQNCLVSLRCFDRKISEATRLCHLGVSIYQSPFAADKCFQRVVVEVGL